MTVKDFFYQVELLNLIHPDVVNTNKGKIDIFINRLKVDIAKDILMGVNFPKNYIRNNYTSSSRNMILVRPCCFSRTCGMG